MASCTKKLKARRGINQRRSGKARKANIRNNGTTAKNLPLDVPNANELAQKKK